MHANPAAAALVHISGQTRAFVQEQMCSLPSLTAHCNAGLFTWWVLRQAPGRGQASRVLAVEPMSQNIAVMQANLQRHGLASQVVHADCLQSSCCDTAGQYHWPPLHVNTFFAKQ